MLLSPHRSSAWVQLGHAFKEKGALDQALDAYATAARLDPQAAEIYFHRGHLNKTLGDRPAAIRDYKAALRLNSFFDAAAAELVSLGCEQDVRRVRDGDMVILEQRLAQHRQMIEEERERSDARLSALAQTIDRVEAMASRSIALEAASAALSERADRTDQGIDQRFDDIIRHMDVLAEDISGAQARSIEMSGRMIEEGLERSDGRLAALSGAVDAQFAASAQTVDDRLAALAQTAEDKLAALAQTVDAGLATLAQTVDAGLATLAQTVESVEALANRSVALEEAGEALAERADRIDQQFEHTARQMGTLLDHISVAKALGFEVARLHQTIGALSHDQAGKDALFSSRLADAEEMLATVARFGERLDPLDDRLGAVEGRLGDTERRAGDADKRLDDADKRLGDADKRLGEADKQLGSVDKRLGTVDKRAGDTERRITAVAGELAERFGPLDRRMAVAEKGAAVVGTRLDGTDRRLQSSEDTLAAYAARLVELDALATGLGSALTAVGRLDMRSEAAEADRHAASRRVSELEAFAFTARAAIADLATLTQTVEQTRDEISRDTSVASFAAKLASFEHATAVIARLSSDLEGRVKSLERGSKSRSNDTAASSQSVAVATDVALTIRNHEEMLHFLLGRVEFVRRELMYEMKYGTSGRSPDGGLRAEARIKDRDKVEAATMAGDLKLNVGCGHIIAPGSINVDSRDLLGVDVIAEADDMPFAPESVSEIRSSHLLEHFPQEALTRLLLPHWISLLRPGGRLLSIVPDGQAMVSGYADSSYPFESFRMVLFGAQDYDGDFHFNLFTPASLTRILGDLGLIGIRVIESGRRNGECFEFEIEAWKPEQALLPVPA